MGYVQEVVRDGIRKKAVSQQGMDAGLFLGMRTSKNGLEYEDIYYNIVAQRIIVAMVCEK